MLAPAPLAASQLKVALKPAAGWEKQLYASTAPHTDLGRFAISGLNSGVLSLNVADNTILLGRPQEVLAVLGEDVECQTAGSGGQCVLTITGLDNFNNAYTAVATIKPPSYAQYQDNTYPKQYAVDFVPTVANALCAVITSVSVTCPADWAFTPIQIVGLPSFNVAPTAAGAYRLLGDKVKLDTTFKIPEAHPVQSGRDKSAYVKRGEIPAGMLVFTSKEKTLADGIMRLNGTPVTGLVREIKEGKVETARYYVCGLVLTVRENAGESVEDVTVDAANGFYEIGCLVQAG